MKTASLNGSRFNLLPLNNFSREMNRWINELSSDANCVSCAPVSIWQTDTHFHFQFDLPGFEVNDIELKVVENVLHVTGHRDVDDNIDYLRQERYFGAIERQFSLPARIDEAGIEAEMTAGVLTVNVPKAPESQVKTIEIKSS